MRMADGGLRLLWAACLLAVTRAALRVEPTLPGGGEAPDLCAAAILHPLLVEVPRGRVRGAAPLPDHVAAVCHGQAFHRGGALDRAVNQRGVGAPPGAQLPTLGQVAGIARGQDGRAPVRQHRLRWEVRQQVQQQLSAAARLSGAWQMMNPWDRVIAHSGVTYSY